MQVCFIFRKILRLKNSGSFGRCVCNHFLKWTYYTLTSNIFIYVLPITSITSSTTNCITVSVHDICPLPIQISVTCIYSLCFTSLTTSICWVRSIILFWLNLCFSHKDVIHSSCVHQLCKTSMRVCWSILRHCFYCAFHY